MSADRDSRGRFGAGNRANPHGRPRKTRSVNDTILKELRSQVTITENKVRRKISKLAANTKQVANQGASGDLRAAKMVIDYALKAQGDQAATPGTAGLTQSDGEILERFLAQYRASLEPGGSQ